MPCPYICINVGTGLKLPLRATLPKKIPLTLVETKRKLLGRQWMSFLGLTGEFLGFSLTMNLVWFRA